MPLGGRRILLKVGYVDVGHNGALECSVNVDVEDCMSMHTTFHVGSNTSS